MNFLFFVWGFALPLAAAAHPVAYQGSVGIMGYHSAGMTDLELNYSVRHWLAPSAQILRFTHGTSRPDYVLGKINLLARRWNGEDHQANIYLHGGAGHSRFSDGLVFHGGVTADAESRRLYVFGQWDLLRNAQRTEATFWKVRAGFAPYVSNFEGLHTWLILEANRKSVGEAGAKTIELVPTLRFFYQNVLWEIGSSLGGEFHLNYIIHL